MKVFAILAIAALMGATESFGFSLGAAGHLAGQIGADPMALLGGIAESTGLPLDVLNMLPLGALTSLAGPALGAVNGAVGTATNLAGTATGLAGGLGGLGLGR